MKKIHLLGLVALISITAFGCGSSSEDESGPAKPPSGAPAQPAGSTAPGTPPAKSDTGA